MFLAHSHLIDIAERWLMKSKGCGFVLRELQCSGTSEIPDIIGFKLSNPYSHSSILVECKVSRADFLADAKKDFRRKPESGVGAFRFYLCPAGVIHPEDLPRSWGLVWIDEKWRATQVVGPKGNAWTFSGAHFLFAERNMSAEWGMMASALRRLHLRGVLPQIYENPFPNKEDLPVHQSQS